MPDIIEFDRPKITPSIIMVTGVGGGGSNAVNHMYDLGIADVSFRPFIAARYRLRCVWVRS